MTLHGQPHRGWATQGRYYNLSCSPWLRGFHGRSSRPGLESHLCHCLTSCGTSAESFYLGPSSLISSLPGPVSACPGYPDVIIKSNRWVSENTSYSLFTHQSVGHDTATFKDSWEDEQRRSKGKLLMNPKRPTRHMPDSAESHLQKHQSESQKQAAI